MRCLATLAVAGWLLSSGTHESNAQDPTPSEPPAKTLRELSGDPKAYDAAVALGRKEADEEIQANRATIWQFGLVRNLDAIDRETGLFYSGFGCVVDARILGRVEGHNARLKESIRDHGLPKNSFKPWEKELFELQTYYASQSKLEPPTRLTLGGPEVRSPDGKFRLKLVKWTLPPPPPPPTATPDEAPPVIAARSEVACLLVNDQKPEDSMLIFPLNDFDLVWGPKGSSFLVILSRSFIGNQVSYQAVDLATSRTIRSETK